jgi:hypothetical protein
VSSLLALLDKAPDHTWLILALAWLAFVLVVGLAHDLLHHLVSAAASRLRYGPISRPEKNPVPPRPPV